MALPNDHQFKDGEWLMHFFDSVGDRSGSINMSVDGSVTPVEFKITAPSDRTYFVHRFTSIILASGSIDSGGYGNGAALPNGSDMLYRPVTGPDVVLSTQLPITMNADYAAYAYDISHHDWGLGDQFISWRFTITKDGATFRLDSGASLVWTINDDVASRTTRQYIRAGIVSVDNRYLR